MGPWDRHDDPGRVLYGRRPGCTMNESGFDDLGFAARFRDWVILLIGKQIDILRPRPRYGTVASVNGTVECTVVFDGETEAVAVALFGVVPTVGQRVRVAGPTGDRYVEAAR